MANIVCDLKLSVAFVVKDIIEEVIKKHQLNLKQYGNVKLKLKKEFNIVKIVEQWMKELYKQDLLMH